MGRYQVGVGDEFPLGEQSRPHGRPGPFGGRKLSKVLKVLLLLSVVGIVLSHPLHAAMIITLLLLLSRLPILREAQARWQRRWDAGARPWRGRDGHDQAFV